MKDEILNAIEHLKDINLIAKNRHMMRSMDDELEEGEVQVYRDRFNAVVMAMKALEKQIGMKPNFYTYMSPYGEDGYMRCEACHTKRDLSYLDIYCPICGQKIDWGTK